MNVQGNATWRGLDLRWVYSDLLLSIVRQTRCVHRAYDVVQDALLRYMLVRMSKPIATPHAYLRSVAASVLTDHWRENDRFRSLPETELLDIAFIQAGRFSPSPEQLAELQQRLEQVQRVLNALPPRCREVFWMFRIEGLRQADIAEQLGISVNMVERHVIRALLSIEELHAFLER